MHENTFPMLADGLCMPGPKLELLSLAKLVNIGQACAGCNARELIAILLPFANEWH